MKILILEDDLLFADALREVLLTFGDVDEVEIVPNGSDAARAAQHRAWDVILLDIRSRGAHAFQCGISLSQCLPRAKVVALMDEAAPKDLRDALRAGLHGCLTKDITPDELIRSIQALLRGKRPTARSRYRPKGHSDDLLSSLLPDQLTHREKQVLRLLVDGLDGTQIARLLHVAPNTVRTHVQNVLVKLQVHSRLEAVAFAIKHGLVDQMEAYAS